MFMSGECACGVAIHNEKVVSIITSLVMEALLSVCVFELSAIVMYLGRPPV